MTYIECPICLDEQKDYNTLICGHQLCLLCERKLKEHNCYKRCPLCRTPLNWIGLIAIENHENRINVDEESQQIVETITEPETESEYESQTHTQLQLQPQFQTYIQAQIQIGTRPNLTRRRIIIENEEDNCLNGDDDFKELASKLICGIVVIIVLLILIHHK